ncbi:dTDP-4-dehydrorhamnose reductase [uncultured Pseudokineococcus sp.]|uniref:dTDP-4-dehydrorhamnose reductase n=1 Tax=uncultured Pseudokineococcus sp. TaxID=1642928 RepID=UPI00262669F5|nr:dTDP-4-dehydrorhamnose reductase [uncultured Pseudokineococcus sp.]
MTTRRWAVVGAGGMLGREVVDVLRQAGEDVTGLARADLDATDAAACRDRLAGADVVVNAAAWTAVDDAEQHEGAAFAANALAPANLGRAAAATGARLVHVSTDYVFDGRASEPYAEDAVTAPRSAYGRTKLAGEWAAAATCPDHLLVRTAWLYGDGKCFPRTIARLLGQRDTVSVVDDQLGQPTWTRDVADLVLRLVRAEVPTGTHHATSSGRASWHDLARAVATSLGTDPERVRPTTSADFPTPAERPAWSVLGHEGLRAAGVEPVGDWADRWTAAAPHVLAETGSAGA